ncbi:hypothetical protein BDR05DRAFT_962808 [Suillus weaverae]|nr:hypothetical protein BDR05DRAFT_962808 [Suillus weaverae]
MAIDVSLCNQKSGFRRVTGFLAPNVTNELSWYSRSRVRNPGLQNKIYFDSIEGFHFGLISHCNTSTTDQGS